MCASRVRSAGNVSCSPSITSWYRRSASARSLKAVRSQVAQLQPGLQLSLDQTSRRLRDQDLASVRCAGDARSVMHVEPDVFVPDQRRLARVQADADPERLTVFPGVACEGSLSGGGGQARVDGAREHAEERIAFSPQLVPVVAPERFPENLVVSGLRRRVAVAHLLHQPGGVLDVGEQEGDRAARQVQVRPFCERRTQEVAQRRHQLLVTIGALKIEQRVWRHQSRCSVTAPWRRK